MAQVNKILLGKITKLHGFEGAVTVKLENDFPENIPLPESVFLEIEGRPVPFFVDYIEKVSSEKVHLKFQDYDNLEKVREFAGCKVLISAESVSRLVTDNKNNYEGYKIFSDKKKLLGTVSEVIKNPSQWLLRVLSGKGNEILIPFHEDLIVEIDDRLKIVRMIIPDGLADIN
jgi:16S rRNA processing protein RimM